MYHYAQIDASGVVVGMSFLSGEVVSDSMVLLSESDVVDIGWRYKDGEWIEPLSEPTKPPIPEPTLKQTTYIMMSISADMDILNANNTTQMSPMLRFSLTESPLYSKWYDMYMSDFAEMPTMNRLVASGVLTQEELDTMIADRKNKYGY